MNYVDLILCDTMNGPGLRTSLFVSGCTMNCQGCFNKLAQNFRAGQKFTESTIDSILESLDNDEISGLSLLGGDPLERQNLPSVLNLCIQVKAEYPNKSIWLWTGRTLNEIHNIPLADELLDYVDVLIDGRFVEALKDDESPYRGSTNQNVIYLSVQ